MRVAVTGARGRLGRAAVSALTAAGHPVLALDRAADDEADATPPDATGGPGSLESHRVDLADFTALRDRLDGADALLHLAAFTSPHDLPEPGVHHNNVVASYNALEAAAEVGIRRMVLASSVNAIGGVYSSRARFDYFPVDEDHPAYPEDSYSLSKWIGEQQAAALARRYPDLQVSCLRLHALRDRGDIAGLLATDPGRAATDLWGYTPMPLAVQACLGGLVADVDGSQTFYVVAEDTFLDVDSEELRRRFHPDVPVREVLVANQSFFDSTKARKSLL